MKSQNYQKEKQRIFDIAVKLIDKYGFENLGIRTICEKADISIGKFYRYFDSKTDLLSFFYAKVDLAYEESGLDDIIAEKSLPEQFLSYYKWYASFIENEIGLEIVFYFFSSQNPAMQMRVYNNPMINRASSFVDRALAKGESLPPNITQRDLCYRVCTISKGVIFDWCAHNGEYSLSQYMEEMISVFLKGLFPR